MEANILRAPWTTCFKAKRATEVARSYQPSMDLTLTYP